MLGSGSGSKMTDSAPPYEELDTQADYAAVPQDDHPLADEEQHSYQPPHQHAYLNRATGCANENIPLPSAATFQPHAHCEACDGFLQRQQRMRAERFCCVMVAATFMVAFVCAMILGIAIAKAKRSHSGVAD